MLAAQVLARMGALQAFFARNLGLHFQHLAEEAQSLVVQVEGELLVLVQMLALVDIQILVLESQPFFMHRAILVVLR